jgi:thiaminase (transcriptional activator TenA)
MFDLYAARKKGFSMKFSECLWQETFPIYQQILQHPFNTELAEGTLDEKRFIFYMEQDSYYLISFSRALALIAGRATSSKTIQQFLSFSLGVLVGERELPASFLPSNNSCDRIEPSPSCLAYTQYFLATATTAPLEEAVTAVLPCFWIYREVGRHIAAHCKHANPYMRWIETYSSQEFSDGTDQAIFLLDELAGQASTGALERMKKAFEYSSLFEWHFWNDAYAMIVFRDSIV